MSEVIDSAILSTENMVHIHKVLSSDIKECQIFDRDTLLDLKYTNRIETNQQILKKIEMLLGYVPKWKYP